jgi:hypothetical protein
VGVALETRQVKFGALTFELNWESGMGWSRVGFSVTVGTQTATGVRVSFHMIETGRATARYIFRNEMVEWITLFTPQKDKFKVML